MYTVECKNCGNYYESGVNRSGICPNCKVNVRGKNNTRYRDKTYDTLTIYVPKGNREGLKSYAKQHGMSLNELVNNAIAMYCESLEKAKHNTDTKEQSEDVFDSDDFPF